MLRKTHLAINLAIALNFLPRVNDKLLFLPVVLLAGLIPDLDKAFEFLAKKKILKPLQSLSGHRGVFHSYTLCIIGSVFLALYFPIFALPFFLGYSIHLFSDSFTIEGIRPFWPFKAVASGKLRTGEMLKGRFSGLLYSYALCLLFFFFIEFRKIFIEVFFLRGMIFIIGVIVALVALVIFLNKYQNFSGNFFNFIMIALIISVVLSGVYVYYGSDIDLTTFKGIVSFGRLYASWLFGLFRNTGRIVGYAVQQDWAVNASVGG